MSIAQETGLDPADIQTIKKQALGLADALPQKRKNSVRKRHKLTKEERQRGQRRGQKTRAQERERAERWLRAHIKRSGTRAIFATTAYFLAKGSRKEFMVTAATPEIATLFVNALKDMGAPDQCVECCWRNILESLPPEWKGFSHPIEFSKSPGPNSMRIRARPFMLQDGTKISSRALGQAFFKLGQVIISTYAE